MVTIGYSWLEVVIGGYEWLSDDNRCLLMVVVGGNWLQVVMGCYERMIY